MHQLANGRCNHQRKETPATYNQCNRLEESTRREVFNLPRDQAGKQVAERRGDEPDPHHLADTTWRGQLRHRGEAHRAEAELADCVEEIGDNEP